MPFPGLFDRLGQRAIARLPTEQTPRPVGIGIEHRRIPRTTRADLTRNRTAGDTLDGGDDLQHRGALPRPEIEGICYSTSSRR